LFKQLPTHQLSLPMTWYTTYHLRPNLNRAPRPSQGSALILHYHKKPFPKPLQLACIHNFHECKHISFSNLWDLSMGGQKVKKLAKFFTVDARVLYVLVVKISDFFDFFWNLCVISKVAFIVFEWLIFKLDFDLDDDLIWI
jgi:hypothetical protein